MTVSKALGLGIVVLLGLATLDVAGPSPFGASADAATNCPPNTPANKCRAAARTPVAGNANQPKSGGAPAGTAASPEKGSPRKAAEDAKQRRQLEEETNRQKKQAAEEAARQKQQAAKNSAKQQSSGNTGTPGALTSTKANAGTSGTPPGGPGSGSAKPTSGAGTASGTPCGGGATLVGGRCTCPAGAHTLTAGGLQCVDDNGRPLTGPGPVAAPSPKPGPCSGGATLVNNTCTCPAGTRRGPQQRCVPVCGAGQKLSPDGTSCVAAVLNCTGGMVPTNGACRCPPGTSAHTGPGGQQCFTQCPAGTAQGPDGGGTCVAVDENGNWIRGGSVNCPGGSTLLNNTCTCPAGTRALGGSELRCGPVCGAGQQLSPDGTTCVAAVLNCTGGMVPTNGACRCPPGTNPGTGPDGQRCLTQCPAGQAQALGGSGKCVAVNSNGNAVRLKWKPDHGRQLPGWLDAGEQHLHLSGRHTPLSRGGRGRAALPAELRCRPAAFAGRHVLFCHPCGGPIRGEREARHAT